jgi:NADH:ubiquinone oxidoreductase subunit 3 (subunit A)
MNSGSSWDSYYIVFLSAILSLGIPASLGIISYLFFQKRQKGQKRHQGRAGGQNIASHSRPNRTLIGQKMNVRFFLAANAALILITLALELIPCVVTLQSQTQEGLVKGLVSIITLSAFAVLGLLYSVRKGDMGWVSTFQSNGTLNPVVEKTQE